MEISFISEHGLLDLAKLYQQLIPSDVSVATMRDVFKRQEKNPDHMVWGAKIDGHLVGTVMAVIFEPLLGHCKPLMVIEDVIVDKAYRHQGVGKALIHAVEERAMDRKCLYIMLITDSHRLDALQFYKAVGYSQDGYCAFKKYLYGTDP